MAVRLQNQVYRISWTWNYSEKMGIPECVFSTLYDNILKKLMTRYPKCKVVFQLERGAQGRLHYQGHIKLAQKIRPLTFAKEMKDVMPFLHVSPDSGRGSKDAEFYCMKKDETHVAGPWADPSFVPPYDGHDMIKIEQFHPWQAYLYNLVKGDINPDKVLWISQPSGGCGKSSFTRKSMLGCGILISGIG